MFVVKCVIIVLIMNSVVNKLGFSVDNEKMGANLFYMDSQIEDINMIYDTSSYLTRSDLLVMSTNNEFVKITSSFLSNIIMYSIARAVDNLPIDEYDYIMMLKASINVSVCDMMSKVLELQHS